MNDNAPQQPLSSCGVVASTLIKVAKELGYKVTEVSWAEMDKAKANSRAEDTRLITSGEATSEEIQQKNNCFPGEITVLDWSPTYR